MRTGSKAGSMLPTRGAEIIARLKQSQVRSKRQREIEPSDPFYGWGRTHRLVSPARGELHAGGVAADHTLTTDPSTPATCDATLAPTA